MNEQHVQTFESDGTRQGVCGRLARSPSPAGCVWRLQEDHEGWQWKSSHGPTSRHRPHYKQETGQFRRALHGSGTGPYSPLTT